jgi:hypothetical protein
MSGEARPRRDPSLIKTEHCDLFNQRTSENEGVDMTRAEIITEHKSWIKYWSECVKNAKDDRELEYANYYLLHWTMRLRQIVKDA